MGSNGLEPSTSRLSGVRSNHLSYEPISVAGRFHGQTCGGDEQNRTVDPLLARQVLSQLSYAPILKVCTTWVSPPFEVPEGPSKLNSAIQDPPAADLAEERHCVTFFPRRQTLTILVPFDLDV